MLPKFKDGKFLPMEDIVLHVVRRNIHFAELKGELVDPSTRTWAEDRYRRWEESGEYFIEDYNQNDGDEPIYDAVEYGY